MAVRADNHGEMLSNDVIRQMLLDGAHEAEGWQDLFGKIIEAEMFTCFSGDPMGNPQPWPMELTPGQTVIPVYTHTDYVLSNVPCPPGSWEDEIGIRQAASYALSRGFAGVYVNFRANGWLLQGDLLSAAAIGQVPAA